MASDVRAVFDEANRLHNARHQAMAVDDTFATVSGRWRDDVMELLARMAEIVGTPLPEDFPAEPVGSWPAPRPMSDLPDGHKESVLIGYEDGHVISWRGTYRSSDVGMGRVCWWPLPEVPAELREAQS